MQNWLTLAGLTYTKEHLQIQTRKRLEKQEAATLGSKITRRKRSEKEVQAFIQRSRKYLDDPFFVAGILLYEAEGSKGSSFEFSNSDYRLILTFLNFLKKYKILNTDINLRFRLYIHETRKKDLPRIIIFWSKKLSIKPDIIKISWKHNKIVKRRSNLDYTGQFDLRSVGISHLTRKLIAVSDIILRKYQRI